MLKEIYAFLQSKSRTFPWVEATVVKEHFIDKIGLGNKNLVTTASLYNITLETCVQGEKARGSTSHFDRVRKLCRYQFIEILVRFAIFLFCNTALRSGMQGMAQHKDDPDFIEKQKYQNLTPAQAFYIFIESKVRPYFNEMSI